MGTKDCLRHDTRGAMPTAKENKEKKRSGQNIGPEGEGKYLLRERERGGEGEGVRVRRQQRGRPAAISHSPRWSGTSAGWRHGVRRLLQTVGNLPCNLVRCMVQWCTVPRSAVVSPNPPTIKS